MARQDLLHQRGARARKANDKDGQTRLETGISVLGQERSVKNTLDRLKTRGHTFLVIGNDIAARCVCRGQMRECHAVSASVGKSLVKPEIQAHAVIQAKPERM